MLRGMHYMCWFGEDWNYHPSLPMKRLQQVQDIVDVRGNLLLWSCLGSAAIGLQYLDKEANEDIPPRLRFYGYLNDREFCAECARRGIAAYAVVWKAQLWEFPAEFNPDESELLALNKPRGVSRSGWLGMSELSTDRYPQLFDPIGTYFPDGLVASDGTIVGDYLAAFKVVTLDGHDVQSVWLLVPGHDHRCYTPCGNNPAFLTYLKKEIEMMVDAGAGGILIDEFDAHLHALYSAGCFCKECMRGFREYLRAHPCDEAQGIDLETFDYGRFLRDGGYTDTDLLAVQRERRMLIPLYRQFIAYNVAGMEGNVAEIAAHAKGYAREKRGEEIPVTANLFNCLPHAGSVRKYCDIIVGEKSGIKLRQDGFYRFGAAFLGGKEGCFIEDPNDYILRVVEDIKNGKNDTYILLMLEPLAQGFNMAVPYGAWLMNLAKDSFYPDLDLERRMGRWLTEHEHLFPRQPVAETALIYDLRSALETELFLGGHGDRERDGGFRTFHDLAQLLCDHHVLYNVLYVGDDEPLTGERLAGYKKLIIPDALSLPDGEVGAIEGWIAHGGKAVAVGKADRRLYGISHVYHRASAFLDWVKEGGQIVDAEDIEEIGVGLHRRGAGYVLHLVNYNLNTISREIETVPTMAFTLSWKPAQVRVHSFPASKVEATLQGEVLLVENIGIYTIVDLQ